MIKNKISYEVIEQAITGDTAALDGFSRPCCWVIKGRKHNNAFAPYSRLDTGCCVTLLEVKRRAFIGFIQQETRRVMV